MSAVYKSLVFRETAVFYAIIDCGAFDLRVCPCVFVLSVGVCVFLNALQMATFKTSLSGGSSETAGTITDLCSGSEVLQRSLCGETLFCWLSLLVDCSVFAAGMIRKIG